MLTTNLALWGRNDFLGFKASGISTIINAPQVFCLCPIGCDLLSNVLLQIYFNNGAEGYCRRHVFAGHAGDPSQSPQRLSGDASSKVNPSWNPNSASHTLLPHSVGDSQLEHAQTEVAVTPPTISILSPPGSYLGRAEYISGVVPIDEEDARLYSQENQFHIPESDMRYLHDIGAFDLPSRAMRSSLIESYMERCAPWMPIVDKDELDGPKPSMLLLHAVFAAGSRVLTAPKLQEAGRIFYQRAKALFHMDVEKDPLTVIRAICVVQWWNPSGPEHVSMNASSFWQHMGVALAHQVGLHREPNPKQPEASLRRRLWWVLFIRDCMISLSHGRPRSICMEDYNVRRPTLDDFPTANQDAHLFIAYVEIASILADITEASVRGILGRARTLSIETRLSDWIKNLPPDLCLYDQQTGKLAPYQFKTRQLHIPYFTALTILYRPTVPGGNLSTVALLASSFVAGIYEEFIARDDVSMLASTFIFHILASAITQLLCYRYPTLWAKAEPELEILNQALNELTKRFPTGFGAQRVIKHAMQAVKKESQIEGPPVLSEMPEGLNFFSSFGPELSSKWGFVYGSRSEDKGAFKANGISMHSTSLLQPTHDNRNHIGDILIERRPVALIEPYSNPGPITIPPAWTGGSIELNSLDGMMPSAFEADAHRGSIGATFDSVGNWMLSDWITDMN
ncbi:hypothetical protein B7463_g5090, partial [Scytalidium lignicola]